MPKRILEGLVVSDKGNKTVVVKVERTILHPVLKKPVRVSKRYHAHDELILIRPAKWPKLLSVRQNPSSRPGKCFPRLRARPSED